MLGDWRDALDLLAKTNAAVCDPPFGIRHRTNHGASWAGTEIAGDFDTSARDEFVTWLGERPGAFCGTWKMPAPAGTRAAVVWDKGPAFGMGDLSLPWKPSWELVFVTGQGWRGRRGEGVLRGPCVASWESAGRVHPHEKPVWLMRHFVDRLPASARTVADPFMGSGPCAVAALSAGLAFVGCELDPKHHSSACRRVEGWMRQTDLFTRGVP